MTIAAGSDTGDEKLDGGVLKVAGVVVLGAVMSILDVTVVSVALPTFQREFNATYATVAWTMTAYTLALATVIPITGWAADRFGTKRLYLASLVLFVAGSVLCSMAWDIGPLADAFGGTYVVALVLIVLCLVPALFLPRKKIDRAVKPEHEQTVPATSH